MYTLLKFVSIILCSYVNIAMCRSTASDSSLRTEITTWLTTTTLSPQETEIQRESRSMIDYDDHDDLLAESEAQMQKSTPKTTKGEEAKAVKTDPWYGYYDFLINEGSFKFWAVFQLATAALLIYSSFAAVYYAKFNPLSSDYDYYGDDFFKRRRRRSAHAPSFQMDAQTFQRIMDAITPKKS